jgi:hypothetical protein
MRRRNPPPPAAASTADDWQRISLTVESDDQRAFTLDAAAALDEDGDPKARIEYSGGTYNAPDDFTTAGTTLTWAGTIPLVVGESLTLWIVPQRT